MVSADFRSERSHRSGVRSQNGALHDSAARAKAPETQREQNSRYDAHNGLMSFTKLDGKRSRELDEKITQVTAAQLLTEGTLQRFIAS